MTIEKPNYTQIPNFILDNLMCELSGSDLKVILCICRKTFGWHKEKDKISITQIMKLTGLGRTQVVKSTKSLFEKGLIEVKKSVGKTTEFSLIIQSDFEPVQKVNQTSSESELVLVQKVNPQKKINKLIKEKSLYTEITKIIYDKYYLLTGEKLNITNKEGKILKQIEKLCITYNKDDPLYILRKKIKILENRIKLDKNNYYSMTPQCIYGEWNKLTEIINKKDSIYEDLN